MSNTKKPHTAAGQAIGYFFQARYSLFLLLDSGRTNPDTKISIEKFDDVSFDSNAKPLEQIQLKHSIRENKQLTNKSIDLWKTLAIWASEYKNDSETKYTIITTAKASEDSIAYLLTPNEKVRDTDSAAEKLTEIASDNKPGKTNNPFYDKFLTLEGEYRKDLLSKVYIFDSSPNIKDTKREILKTLSYSTQIEYQEHLFSRLEGWWFNKVIEHLSGGSEECITGHDLRLYINSLQEQLFKDNLPIDFLEYEPSEEEISDHDRIFIHQLKLIAAHSNKIRFAIQDYYKAYYQRSRWLRENLVSPDDLEKYEKRLIEEWQRLFSDMQEDLPENQEEKELIKAGQSLYRELDKIDRESVYIRPKCKEPYVTRGSYQILADQLKVGWRVDFCERLKCLTSTAKETLSR